MSQDSHSMDEGLADCLSPAELEQLYKDIQFTRISWPVAIEAGSPLREEPKREPEA